MASPLDLFTNLWSMVLILDGNFELAAHVRSNLCYLICLRHLIRSKAVKNRIVFLRKKLHAYECTEVPSNISTMLCNNPLSQLITHQITFLS